MILFFPNMVLEHRLETLTLAVSHSILVAVGTTAGNTVAYVELPTEML